MSRVLLFTGGLDSVCAWHLLGQPTCLHVNLDGRTWEDAWAAHTRLDIPVTWAEYPWESPAHEDGHVPLRNLHLATVGALYGDEVILGAVRGESSPDKSDKFLRATSRALTAASQGKKISVVAPLKGLTKRELVEALSEILGTARARGIIKETRSCYSREYERCGECMACFRRWVALSLNDIWEPHHRPPWQWEPPGWDERLRYLRDAPPSEWPGIAQINAEAWLAVKRMDDSVLAALLQRMPRTVHLPSLRGGQLRRALLDQRSSRP